MKDVLIVLGSPNSSKGELSDIALGRLNSCLKMFDPEKNLILCTGGFGKTFNITNKPHAEYAMEYLISNVHEKAFFMDIALSSHTVDDAIKIKELLVNKEHPVKIITSNYHLKRVKLIFDQLLTDVQIEYYGVNHKLPLDVQQKLIAHEKKAIAEIEKNGIYLES